MQDFTLDIKATTEDDVSVPIKITVEYPDDQGLLAYKALRHAAENYGSQIIAGLASTGDLSLLAAMREKGIAIGDDEDDD